MVIDKTLYGKYMSLTKKMLLQEPDLRLRFNQGITRNFGGSPFYISRDILFNPAEKRFVINAGNGGGICIGDNSLAFDIEGPLSRPITFLTDLFSDVQNPTELELTTAALMYPEFVEVVESAYENVYLKKTLSGF